MYASALRSQPREPARSHEATKQRYEENNQINKHIRASQMGRSFAANHCDWLAKQDRADDEQY